MKQIYLDLHTHSRQKTAQVKSVFNLEKNHIAVASLFSTGIHPWFIQEGKTEVMLEKIKANLSLKQAIFLGECGLDKAIETNFELQQKVFKAQLEINTAFHKPVVLHCVRSFQEIQTIINDFPYHFVFHAFNKGEILAQQLVSRGYYLSFGKTLFTNKKVQQAFIKTPLHKIFLETDHSHFKIEELYLKAAALKQISLAKLQTEIEQNFNKIVKQ